jgi:hypothetical protein
MPATQFDFTVIRGDLKVEAGFEDLDRIRTEIREERSARLELSDPLDCELEADFELRPNIGGHFVVNPGLDRQVEIEVARGRDGGRSNR